ncbi:hypothetical protein ETF27_03955 [Prevotella brunnea]|uniref:Uncharacterized protein n=1 Tax=Prevotella brunnea TaxID=2508867 RepID=A0A5C8GKK4_9BACT|nr:hypothetical protein ETF27_03955 [Prevotella brunnea]
MQIVPFPAYYQSVYTNFDFTSFSLISCTPIHDLLHCKSLPFGQQKVSFRQMNEENLGHYRTFLMSWGKDFCVFNDPTKQRICLSFVLSRTGAGGDISSLRMVFSQ